ncbi:S8 family serine peptidase, partial [Bradyrhizobium sp. 25ACV]
DTEHPDLKDQIIGGKNFTDDDNGDAEKVKDYNGHGTHVAGTIAATDQNGGILGVAPEAKLLIVKVLGGENGSGKYEWIINGIN